jgi:hypothetical protein
MCNDDLCDCWVETSTVIWIKVLIIQFFCLFSLIASHIKVTFESQTRSKCFPLTHERISHQEKILPRRQVVQSLIKVPRGLNLHYIGKRYTHESQVEFTYDIVSSSFNTYYSFERPTDSRATLPQVSIIQVLRSCVEFCTYLTSKKIYVSRAFFYVF